MSKHGSDYNEHDPFDSMERKGIVTPDTLPDVIEQGREMMARHSEVEGLVECGKCKEVKPLSLFVFRSERASNHRRVCLECEKLRVKTNYRKNVKWFKKRDSKVTPQDKARAQFAQAVKSGKIKRQPCEVCAEPKSHGHHPDYKEPLVVNWLCVKHHAEVHKGNRQNV